MRSSTLVSLAGLVLAFLVVNSYRMEARGAIILPLIIFKKLPKHDHLEHLKKLLQFVNLDAITGLVGQLINFDAVLKHLSPNPAQTTNGKKPTMMMMDDPATWPMEPTGMSSTVVTYPTLPPIPVTPAGVPEFEMSPSEAIPSDCSGDSARCPTSEDKQVITRHYLINAGFCEDPEWCPVWEQFQREHGL